MKEYSCHSRTYSPILQLLMATHFYENPTMYTFFISILNFTILMSDLDSATYKILGH